MEKNARRVLYVLITIVLFTQTSFGHCQVPCGIYDDHARVTAMLEDVKTIEKSVLLITELSEKSDAQSAQQVTRWVMIKESHAQSIIQTISDYFLTQRVKASQKDYEKRLVKHHTVIVNAMKAKQKVDAKVVTALKESVEALHAYYK